MSELYYIAFDESHKPRGKIGVNYKSLKEYLENNGFVCHSFMEFPITRQNLSAYDILVIPCPDFSKFSKDEIEAIYKWVTEDGGGLIMLSHAGGDKGRRSNLSELAEKFGMSFENDQVLDKVHNFGIENMPEVTNFSPPHPITENITSLCYRAGCSLSTFGLQAVPVVISSEEAEPFSSPLVVAAEVENGRVVGCGSYEIFRDKITGGFNHDQHAQFALNMFNWVKTEYRHKIKTGEVQPKYATIPQAQGASQSFGQLGNQMDMSNANAPVMGNVPGAQNNPLQFSSLNINSQITISSKSDLAALLYGLLNEVDVLKKQIQAIIDTVISSEEVSLPPQGDMGAGAGTMVGAASTEGQGQGQGIESPASMSDIEGQSTSEGGLLGDDIKSMPLSPLPPAPPSLKRKVQTQEVGNNQLEQPPQSPQSFSEEGTSQLGDTATPSISSTPEPAQYQDPSSGTLIFEEEEEKPDVNIEEIQAEISTLQGKLSSIKELEDMVERKYKEKKYTEKQYKKQMSRLENDKKKALNRLNELEEIIKKL
ncbi:MAG: hypothetical protein ACTSU2_10225 [Promethearchaeota archaeon]